VSPHTTRSDLCGDTSDGRPGSRCPGARDADGHVVAERAFSGVRPNRPAIDVRLAPGRYVVTSYQRPCDGNCGYLDPPTDRCRTTVTLAADDDIVLNVEFAPGQGCQFV
jgi:hypothetical protein